MVRFFILAALCLCVNVHAATPMTLSYQGRVLAGGVPFNGTGKFRFALVDGSTIVWNSENGVSAAAPTVNIDLTVTNGLYAVLIGNTVNTTANPYTMAALPVTVFSANNPLSLRVYFGDTAGTVQTLSPDQTIAAVGYAMTAATVNDGAITPQKLADFGRAKVSGNPPAVVGAGTNMVLSWGTEESDTANFFNPATPTLFTIPATGVYLLSGQANYGGNGNVDYIVSIERVSDSMIIGTQRVATSASSGSVTALVTGFSQLNSGDQLRLRIIAASNGTINGDFFQILRIH